MKCLFESVDCEHRNTGGCSRGDCVFAPQEAKEQPADIHQQAQPTICPLYVQGHICRWGHGYICGASPCSDTGKQQA